MTTSEKAFLESKSPITVRLPEKDNTKIRKAILLKMKKDTRNKNNCIVAVLKEHFGIE